jgi:hypothetical protein
MHTLCKLSVGIKFTTATEATAPTSCKQQECQHPETTAAEKSGGDYGDGNAARKNSKGTTNLDDSKANEANKSNNNNNITQF